MFSYDFEFYITHRFLWTFPISQEIVSDILQRKKIIEAMMAEKRVEAVTEIDAVHTNKTKKTMSIQQNRYRKIQFRVCRNVYV